MTEGNILEIGCGSGSAAAEMVKIFPPALKLTAVDLSSEMLKLARAKLPETVTILKASAEDLSLPSSSYDAIYSNLCLQVCQLGFLCCARPSLAQSACRES